MKNRYLTQRFDSFIDEYTDNGFVSLEKALDFFKTYPFNEELKEVTKNEIENRFSKIAFQSENNQKLSIWIENNEGYFFYYENEKEFAQFFIYKNFNENVEGLDVECFLNLFFANNIEQKLNLKKIKPNLKVKKQLINFSFEDTKKLNTLYSSIPWFIGSLIFLIYDYYQSKFGMVIYVHIMLSLFWLPSSLLYLSYWRINKNAIMKIDSFANIISYQKDGERIIFNRNEIDKCVINEEESTSNRSNTKKFSYLHITLFNKEEIIITNFITEPHNIVKLLKLNYKVNDRYMAILPF